MFQPFSLSFLSDSTNAMTISANETIQADQHYYYDDDDNNNLCKCRQLVFMNNILVNRVVRPRQCNRTSSLGGVKVSPCPSRILFRPAFTGSSLQTNPVLLRIETVMSVRCHDHELLCREVTLLAFFMLNAIQTIDRTTRPCTYGIYWLLAGPFSGQCIWIILVVCVCFSKRKENARRYPMLDVP